MARQDLRRGGIGSNQYVTKAPDLRTAVDQEDMVKAQERVIPPSAEEQDAVSEEREEVRAMVAALSATADRSVALGMEGASDQELRRSLGETSKAEDAIMTKYPNMYGFALVDATWHAANVKRSPALRAKISSGDRETVRLHEAYSAVMLDAVDRERLGVDGLAEAIGTISDREERGSFTDDDAEKPDADLINRYTALSVVSGREPGGPSEEQLQEMESIRETLNRSIVQRRLRI